MLIQFFGAINGATGAKLTDTVDSGNFTPARLGPGQYKITLDTWIAGPPVVNVLPKGAGSVHRTATAWATQATSGKYEVTVKTYWTSANPVDMDFYFSISTGGNIVVPDRASPVGFTLEIIDFGGATNNKLVAKYNNTPLDTGTLLLIKTGMEGVTLSVSNTVKDSSGNNYTVQAYTNSAGSPLPQPWPPGPGNTLEIQFNPGDPENPSVPIGTMFGMQSLTFTATKDSDTSKVLWTDPIARIRNIGS